MSNPEEWRQKLRGRGQRLTAQRELVLAAVEKLGHATPDEVLAEVHKSSKAISLSTIYRTLTLLEELELVRHAHLHDRAPTYHSMTSPPHAHTVCRSCRTVQEVPEEALNPLVRELSVTRGFEVDVAHLTVFGTCQACRATT
jgi:Fur family ferric uptake transcriptional regulator